MASPKRVSPKTKTTPTTTTTAKSAAKAPEKAPPRARSAGAAMTLVEVMATLEKAGSAQTKKTYLRHGAKEPLFGVQFATLKDLWKKLRTNHELACALWDTGNFDARNLAVKLADPAQMTPSRLDAWARCNDVPMCVSYVAALASEGPHGLPRAEAWLRAADVPTRATGWSLVGMLAMRDEATPDAWFLARLAEIERTIATVPNAERGTMNGVLIAIGCRNAAMRKAVAAAAKRLGPVEVDHGDTACKTPDARAYIDKTWEHSTSKGFESPAAHERSRESMRLRC